MRGVSASPRGQTSRIVWVAAGIAALLGLFLVENLWIDARLQHRSHRIPSFVPEPQSTSWFLVFAAGTVALLLLVACLVLLVKDHNTSVPVKAGTTLVVALVMLMSVDWFRVTNGQPGILPRFSPKKSHKVVLKWQASPSRISGYNVYRKTGQALGYEKLNASPVQGLTYTDDAVRSGKTYYYVTRSVNSRGDESADSEIFSVAVP
jgi:hypothetical protein